MTTVRSSPPAGGRATGRTPELAGGAVGCSANGSISSVSGRYRSPDIGSRLVSPAGSSMGAGGTYGAGVGGVNARCSAEGGADAATGCVSFAGSTMVWPVEWTWRTSQSLSSSSTGGHTSDGAVPSSIGTLVSSEAGAGSADADGPSASGSAFTGRPAGVSSGEGVFLIAARVFTLIPSWSSVKVRTDHQVLFAL